MRSIHYKQDFPLTVSFTAAPVGVPLGIPDFDFDIRFRSSCSEFMAGRRNGEYYNCRPEDDTRLTVFFDRHGLLPCNELMAEITYHKPSSAFPDGVESIVRAYNTGVSLSADPCRCQCDGLEFEALLPYIKGEQGDKGDDGDKGDKGDKGEKGDEGLTAYELAVRNGYEGEETEWLESLKGDAGQSAYALAVSRGFKGTEAEWLDSLKGKDADPAPFVRHEETDVADDVVTLKDKDGKPLYPVTSAKAVIDSKGVDVESRLEGQESTMGTLATKNEVTSLRNDVASDLNTVNNALTSRLATKQDTLEDSDDIEVEGSGLTVTERVKHQWLVDRFRARLSRFTGLPTFEEDMANTCMTADGAQVGLYGEVFGYEDGIRILEHSELYGSNTTRYYQKCPPGPALFPLLTSTENLQLTYTLCQQRFLGLYEPRNNSITVSPSNCNSTFHSCTNLERIIGAIDMRNCTTVNQMFTYCAKLREVRIYGLKLSISFTSSSYLSLASLQYLIANAANTSAITITVQSAVYAKITGADNASYGDDDPEDWHALLDAALAKNISFAM